MIFLADMGISQKVVKWLKEEDICEVTLWNDSPILVTPPNFITLNMIIKTHIKTI